LIIYNQQVVSSTPGRTLLG